MHEIRHMPSLRARASSRRTKAGEEIHQVQPAAFQVAKNARGRGIHGIRNFAASEESRQDCRSTQARWQAVGFGKPNLLEVRSRFGPVTSPAGIYGKRLASIIVVDPRGAPGDVEERIPQFDGRKCPLARIRKITLLERPGQSCRSLLVC